MDLIIPNRNGLALSDDEMRMIQDGRLKEDWIHQARKCIGIG